MSYPVLCGPRRFAEVGGGSEGVQVLFIVGSRVVLVDSVLLWEALGSFRVVLGVTVVVLGGSVFFCIGSWSYCSRSRWFCSGSKPTMAKQQIYTIRLA